MKEVIEFYNKYDEDNRLKSNDQGHLSVDIIQANGMEEGNNHRLSQEVHHLSCTTHQQLGLPDRTTLLQS